MIGIKISCTIGMSDIKLMRLMFSKNTKIIQIKFNIKINFCSVNKIIKQPMLELTNKTKILKKFKRKQINNIKYIEYHFVILTS